MQFTLFCTLFLTGKNPSKIFAFSFFLCPTPLEKLYANCMMQCWMVSDFCILHQKSFIFLETFSWKIRKSQTRWKTFCLSLKSKNQLSFGFYLTGWGLLSEISITGWYLAYTIYNIALFFLFIEHSCALCCRTAQLRNNFPVVKPRKSFNQILSTHASLWKMAFQ